MQLIGQTASQQKERFHLELQAFHPRVAIASRSQRQQVNQPVDRSTLVTNLRKQLLDGLRTGKIRMKHILARRDAYQGNLLAEIMQPLRQRGCDSGAVIRQNKRAAG